MEKRLEESETWGPSREIVEFTREALEDNKVFREQWYHSIELLPGLFTKGHDFKNLCLTRKLLEGCEIESMNCLDVGAMDGLVSLLMRRRGAEEVTAYDRLDHTKKWGLIKQILGVDFYSVSGMKLSELPARTKALGLHPFDVVVFSGVLYHMFDPMAGLATVRGLVRKGGLLLIETACIIDDGMVMHFNAGGRFFARTNYWQVSVACLDYLLRFMRLEVLDCAYLELRRIDRREVYQEGRIRFGKRKPLELARIGIVCRAVDQCLHRKEDLWMGNQDMMALDFSEFLDWEELRSDNASKVTYRPSNRGLVYHEDTGTVNLYETVRATKGMVIQNPEDQIRLKLEAVY